MFYFELHLRVQTRLECLISVITASFFIVEKAIDTTLL